MQTSLQIVTPNRLKKDIDPDMFKNRNFNYRIQVKPVSLVVCSSGNCISARLSGGQKTSTDTTLL